MLGIEERIDLLLKAVEEDNFEPEVFYLIREGKLDVVPDTEGQPLFIYFHEGQFTSVDIDGNILNDYETRKATDCLEDNTINEKILRWLNAELLCSGEVLEEDELEELKDTIKFVETHNIETALPNGDFSWKSLFPNYKAMKPATSMDVKLTENITLSLFRAEEDFPAYDLHIHVNKNSEAVFEDNMVRDWVVFDKPNNWKTTDNGEQYYVSPKTGWVYMFYELRGLNTKYNTTDKMCCVCEFSNERELLEDGCEGYEVEDIVGWLYVTGKNIPKDDFVDLINEYEADK